MSATDVLSPPDRMFPRDQGTFRAVSEDEMTPRQHDQRSTDASTLTLPLKIALAITISSVVTAVSVTTYLSSKTSGVESRIDVMIVKLDAAADNARLRDEQVKAQITTMQEDIKSLRGRSDLLQLQLQQLQLEQAKRGGLR